METLSLDLKRKIALDLSPKDLIKLCLSSKESFYKGICDDKEFWRLKIFQDYPEIKPYFEKIVLINPKNTYMRIFSKTAKLIEEHITSPNYFNVLYEVYNKVRKNGPYKNIDEFHQSIIASIPNTRLNKLYGISKIAYAIKNIFQKDILNTYNPYYYQIPGSNWSPKYKK